MKRVLAIDGGGIRGIIPGEFLHNLERWPIDGRCYGICELFDLIAGTSTGGILSLGLVAPSTNIPADKHPTHILAGDIVKLYEEKGSTIFSKPRGFLSNLIGPKFKSDGIEEVLADYFGQVRLSQAVKPILITSYDLQQRRPRIFKSWKAAALSHHDCLIAEVARATSAAPTYFSPVKLGGRTLIDGGIFANNPAALAYAEAKRLWPQDSILVVSIGTGNLERPYLYPHAAKWGMLGWSRPLLDCVFDGVSDSTHYMLRQLIPDGRYFRYQANLAEGSEALDDASPQNIERLKIIAGRMFAEYRDRGDINRMMSLLLQGAILCPHTDQQNLYHGTTEAE